MNNNVYTKEDLNSLSKESLAEIILGMQASLNEMNKNYENLLEQLRLMNQRMFGRKTETSSSLGIQQLELLLNEAEVTQEETTEEPALENVVHKKKPKNKKHTDLKKITKQREVICDFTDSELDEMYGKGKWKRLPYEKIYKLEHIPACFEAVTYKIGVIALNDNQTIIRAKKPVELLPKSVVTPSLLASIMFGKYVNAVPLYRQEQAFQANDIFINRTTMANWIIKVCDLYLSQFYEKLKSTLMSQELIHADETPFTVSRDGRPAGTKSYMWVYRDNPLISTKHVILYNYCPTRGSKNPETFLAAYKGLLETDAFSGYRALEKKHPEQYKVAGCWIHALRKFKENLKATKNVTNPVAENAVRQIQEIYSLEHRIAEKNLPLNEKKEQRQTLIKPKVDAFFTWANETYRTIDRSSANGKALYYVLNQEKYLRVFLDEPIVPLDNNSCEQAVRPFTIGRKNWVLVDSTNGAQASAVIYSIVETAKANNLKIYDYLKYLLEELPKHVQTLDGEIPESLLPWSDELPQDLRKPQ